VQTPPPDSTAPDAGTTDAAHREAAGPDSAHDPDVLAATPVRARRAAAVAESPMNVLRGVLMGSAEVVPGVSGGTIALVTGVYERLVDSIDAAVRAGVALVTGQPRRAGRLLRGVDWGLVLPLGVGMVLTVLVAARLIPPAIERYPVESAALFSGLIAASVAVPYREMRERRAVHLLLAAGAAVAAFLLTGLPAQEAGDPPLLAVFAAAAVAICALALPGVSGSFLLLALGLYAPTLQAVNERDLGYVAVFGAGAVTGLALFARLLSWLLDHRRDVTMAVLAGLLVGALRAVWPWSDPDRGLQPPPLDASVLPPLGWALLGVAVVPALLLLGDRAGRAADAAAADEAGGARGVESERPG